MPVNTIKSPFKNKVKKYKWSKEEKAEVFKCYLISKAKNLPITKGTFETWKARNPNPNVKMSEVTLSNQRRSYQKSLTLAEQKRFEREVKSELNLDSDTPTDREEPSPDTTNNVKSKLDQTLTVEMNDDKTRKGNSQNEKRDESNMEDKEDHTPFKEFKMNLRNRLMVVYEETKMKAISERKRLRKYKLTEENKEKLETMNEILTDFIKEKELSISDLNSLHFSVAVILAGEIKPGTKKPERVDSFENLRKKINKLRKVIGKITAYIQDKENEKKIKKKEKKKSGNLQKMYKHRHR